MDVAKLVSRNSQIFSANQSRKGRKNPEPGTAVPGKESNGNQVPFRGRHNQLAGSPPFQSLRFPLTVTYHGCPPTSNVREHRLCHWAFPGDCSQTNTHDNWRVVVCEQSFSLSY